MNRDELDFSPEYRIAQEWLEYITEERDSDYDYDSEKDLECERRCEK